MENCFVGVIIDNNYVVFRFFYKYYNVIYNTKYKN